MYRVLFLIVTVLLSSQSYGQKPRAREGEEEEEEEEGADRRNSLVCPSMDGQGAEEVDWAKEEEEEECHHAGPKQELEEEEENDGRGRAKKKAARKYVV